MKYVSEGFSNQVQKWRKDTPGCSYYIHLNNAGAALMPQLVLHAIHKHIDLEARMGGYEAADHAREKIRSAYRAVASLIGSKPANIAMVENATVATSQALSAFDFQRDDTIITTNVDYASNQIMLLSLAKRFGINLIRAEDLPGGGVDPESVRQLLRRQRPKLLLMSWIPTNSGLIQDARAVGEICREEEVPFVLDACQAVGQIPVDIAKLNCDFLAATGRKFLRGPRGIGFLYVSDRILEKNLEPLFPDTHGAVWTASDTYEPEPGAARFENWEFSHALILGLGAAADYAFEAGIERVAKRSSGLAEYAREKLSHIPGLRLLDWGKNRCAIVSAAIEGKNPTEIVKKLRKEKINISSVSHTAGVIDMEAKNADSVLRISPHYYNTKAEIDELAGKLTMLAD